MISSIRLSKIIVSQMRKYETTKKYSIIGGSKKITIQYSTK
jgi:hypothetical protein